MEFRCTNAEPGTFNHECGKPAVWAGTHPSGHVQNFCARCKECGHEARTVTSWRRIARQSADAAHIAGQMAAAENMGLSPAEARMLIGREAE